MTTNPDDQNYNMHLRLNWIPGYFSIASLSHVQPDAQKHTDCQLQYQHD